MQFFGELQNMVIWEYFRESQKIVNACFLSSIINIQFPGFKNFCNNFVVSFGIIYRLELFAEILQAFLFLRVSSYSG